MTNNNYITIVEIDFYHKRVLQVNDYEEVFLSGNAKTLYVPDQSLFNLIVKNISIEPNLLIVLGCFKSIQPEEGSYKFRNIDIVLKMNTSGFERFSKDDLLNNIKQNGTIIHSVHTNQTLTPSSWVMEEKGSELFVYQIKVNENE